VVGAAEHASVAEGSPGAELAEAGRRPAALALRGISKSWDRRAAALLDGVDLIVNPGEAVAVSGRNGVGKTTLLRIAAGLIAPDDGTVTAGGVPAERDRNGFQRRVGFLAAGNSGLYPRLNAEHHLDLWARLALMPRKQRRQAVARTTETFELEPLCGCRVDRLSMGQRQRLRLALAFIHEPSVVLLDEPTTSLDDEGTAILRAAVDGLCASGGAALICLPSGSERVLPVDRAHVLEGGELKRA
jgi:ABC-2 type transport system ATP-binding protein